MKALCYLLNSQYKEYREWIFPEFLKSLSYKHFLRSDYWATVADYKKSLSPTCQLCNGGGRMHVHHRTYEHHGEEHEHLDDLIVLCNKCHAKFHDKVAA